MEKKQAGAKKGWRETRLQRNMAEQNKALGKRGWGKPVRRETGVVRKKA